MDAKRVQELADEAFGSASLLTVHEAIRTAYREGMLDAARICENGRFLHDEALDARFGKACADAIKREAG